MPHVTPPAAIRSRSTSASSDGTEATGPPNTSPPSLQTSAQYRRRRQPSRSPVPASKLLLRGEPSAGAASRVFSSGVGSRSPGFESADTMATRNPAQSLSRPTALAVNHGRVTYPDGTIYVGEWSNGLQHGFGTCAFPSGHAYIGEWRHGVIDGSGTMLYADGDLFDGRWRNGACEGEGVLFMNAPGAPPQFGVWHAGELATRIALAPGTDLAEERRTILVNVARALQNLPPQPTGVGMYQPPAAAPQVNDPYDAQPSNSGAVLSSSQGRGGSMREEFGGTFGGTLTSFPIMDPNTTIKGDKLELTQKGKFSLGVDVSYVLFAVSGPSYTTTFSFTRFVWYFCSMLFPFLSLPHFPCPMRTNILDLEREYVVSGAALRGDFDSPRGEIYGQLFALFCAIVSSICVSASDKAIRDNTEISNWDVIGPYVSIVFFAVLMAGYQCHVRVAHALERLNRFQFPRLAKFSSSCVDGRTNICVATWDDDGEHVVWTRRYRRRWVLSSLFTALMVALMPSVTRAGNNHHFFAGPHGLSVATAVFSFFAIFSALTITTYYFYKIIDMQRQVLSRMQVLSTCAYLRNQSILRPTDHRDQFFAFEAPLDMSDTFRGYTGWYITRCFVLYASTCANHAGRMAAASMVSLCLVAVYVAAIGDAVYAYSRGLLATEGYFNDSHLTGLALILTLGNVHLMYVYVCAATETERLKHVYLSDVAAAYHFGRGDVAQAQTVTHCRDIIRNHDVRAKIMGLRVSGPVVWFFVVIHCVSVAALTLQFAAWLSFKSD
jgi:hypothetical protein